MTVKILAVGDICGPPGLRMLSKRLRPFIEENDIAFTVVNGENAALTGLTPENAEAIFRAGADVITLGNHTWNRREILSYLDENAFILRPANYAPQTPGRGWGVFETPFGDVCVLNLIGRCDMPFGPDNPFFEADRILKKVQTPIVLVDFHAEATSEKLAMAYHLDGRVTALWGTHTHVQTSDAEVFPKGTGYITDLGMTGAARSVIGIRPEQSVSMYLGNPPQRFEAAEGPAKMEGAVFTVDVNTGRCVAVEAFRLEGVR
ncbi:MAG TPA: TIGR00282 family metallophosphoesterase [Papillibacter sp.]|nr:TIGR00282 family metallophosphoesterase [Papillibacter sp.]